MSSQLNVDTIVDKAGSGGTNVKIGNTSTYVSDGGAVTQNTVQGLAKVWCRWELSGTASIENSYNITSLTDVGTGLSTLTIANDFSDTKYSATMGAGEIAGGGNRQIGMRGSSGLTATVGTISFFHMDLGSGAQDMDLNNLTMHGDLA